MEAAIHAHRDVSEVLGRTAEDGDSVQVLRPVKHLFKRVVYGVASIGLAKPGATVRAQVSHRCDCAIRVLVPVELGPEPATDHTDSNLGIALLGRGKAGWHCGRDSQGPGVDERLPWELSSRFHVWTSVRGGTRPGVPP